MATKQQNQVLLALEAGRKIADFIREPGMPSKALLEEWRNGDPVFDAAYIEAEEKGRVKREGQPKAKPAKPAPVVTDQDGQERPIPQSTALRAAAPAAPRPEPVAAPAPVAVATEVAAPATDTELRDKMLKLRRSSALTTALLREQKGFTSAKMARWRHEDPDFKKAWDEAGNRRPTSFSAPVETASTPTPPWHHFYSQAKQHLDASEISMWHYSILVETPNWDTANSLLETYLQEHKANQEQAVQGQAQAAQAPQAPSLEALPTETRTMLEQLETANEQAAYNGKRAENLLHENKELARQVADYQEYQADQKRLTRELDVALFGEENAAAQASLGDLIGPGRKMRDTLCAFVQQAQQFNQAPPQRVAEMFVLPAPTPQHPGLLLAELLRQAGTHKATFAAALGVRLDSLKGLLRGERRLDVALCAKLEKLCWGTAETWCRRQIDFDAYRFTQPVAA